MKKARITALLPTRIKLALISTLILCACDDNEMPTAVVVVPGETSVYQGITLISVPGGKFQRGSEEKEDTRPVRTIQISQFEMGVYEITNEQYAAYLNEALASGMVNVKEYTDGKPFINGGRYWVASGNGVTYISTNIGIGMYGPKNQCWITYEDGYFGVTDGKANLPVVNVTWHGAMAFAEHYGIDLPTEAEWEYVCRGGKQYEFGTDDGTLSIEKANCYSDCPADVGSYPANPFGVFDMTGNVDEWCKDWYDKDYYSKSPSQDPQGPENAPELSRFRVRRGGYWNFLYFQITSFYRISSVYNWTSVENGFRVVRRK